MAVFCNRLCGAGTWPIIDGTAEKDRRTFSLQPPLSSALRRLDGAVDPPLVPIAVVTDTLSPYWFSYWLFPTTTCISTRPPFLCILRDVLQVLHPAPVRPLDRWLFLIAILPLPVLFYQSAGWSASSVWSWQRFLWLIPFWLSCFRRKKKTVAGIGLPQIIRAFFRLGCDDGLPSAAGIRGYLLRYASDIADGQCRWFYLPALYSVRIMRHQKEQEKGVWHLPYPRRMVYPLRRGGIALLLIALQHVPGYLEPRQSRCWASLSPCPWFDTLEAPASATLVLQRCGGWHDAAAFCIIFIQQAMRDYSPGVRAIVLLVRDEDARRRPAGSWRLSRTAAFAGRDGECGTLFKWLMENRFSGTRRDRRRQRMANDKAKVWLLSNRQRELAAL